MMQSIIPFTDTADIPKAHLYALQVCNSAGYWAHKQSFYKLKNSILEKFGHPADYDLQTIIKKCWTCNGTGWYMNRATCNNCLGDGIYSQKDVVLKRYIINNAVFHQPVGELCHGNNQVKIFNGCYEDEYSGQEYPSFKYEPFNGKIVSVIKGIIKHEPMVLHPVWAYYYLLWNYDRNALYRHIETDIKCYQTRTKHKLKKLLDLHKPLKAYAEFFGVKKKEIEPFGNIEDLPF